MNRPQHKSRSHWGIAAVVFVLIGLPLVYLLSVGPVCWADSEDYLGEPARSTLQFIYAPLVWLAERSDTFGEALKAYCSWWER